MSGLLTNTPQEVVQALLVQQGLGTDGGQTPLGDWPVYVDDEPDAPDKVLTVYGTAGQKDGRSMIDGTVFWHYGIQLRFRGPTQANPDIYAKAAAVVNILNGLHGVSVSLGTQGFTVGALSQTSDILPIGRDTPRTMRRLYTVNYIVTIREVVAL